MLRCTGGKLAPGADGAVSVRQHVIRLWAAQPQSMDNVRARNRGPAGLSRQQPRLYGGGRGRHAVARGHVAGREYRPGRAGLALPAAGALPGAERLKRPNERRDETTRKCDQERNHEDAEIVPARRAQGLDRARGIERARRVGQVTQACAGAGLSAAPPASAITPELIAAAKKEGKVVWYTSVDLPLAERIAKAFEAKYPGVAVRVERTGAERVFQRIGQEYASRIYAVDVVNSSDAAHFIVWKRDGVLAPYVPEDVAKHYPAEHKDPDGMFASFRVFLCVIGYNTDLVKAQEAPKSFADLLDPKWTGKIVKAHPGYSGTIMTATFQIARDLGWAYFEKLAKQRVMQVQSASDPPKKLALGERAVMADGNEYDMFQLKESGKPVEIVYPTEGTPLIVGPNAIFKNAPNPNAARLFQNYMLSAECQQLSIDARRPAFGACAGQGEGRAARRSREIKVMKDDAAGVETESEEIKTRYSKIVQGVIEPVARIAGAEDHEQRVRFSRRDVLKASTRPPPATVVRAAGACAGTARRRAADGDHAGADRGGEEGGQGRLLHLGRPAAGREDRAIVRGQVSRASPCASSAPAPSACSSASARNMRAASTRSTSSIVGRRPFHRLEARRAARAFVPEDVAKHYPGGAQGPGRDVRELPRHPERHRLQHQSGQGRGGAEELRRPARSEMDGQDRQGASEPTAAPS